MSISINPATIGITYSSVHPVQSESRKRSSEKAEVIGKSLQDREKRQRQFQVQTAQSTSVSDVFEQDPAEQASSESRKRSSEKAEVIGQSLQDREKRQRQFQVQTAQSTSVSDVFEQDPAEQTSSESRKRSSDIAEEVGKTLQGREKRQRALQELTDQLSLLSFSIEKDLLEAATSNDWQLVGQILDCYPLVDIDTAASEGPNKGMSVLWLAAHREQWDLVEKMLDLKPDANIDAAPAEGLMKGVSVLWWAACYGKWVLISRMLDLKSDANIDASPAVGDRKGASVLWLVASGHQQWALVKKMLKIKPDANVDAAPAEGPCKGVSVLWLARVNKQEDLVKQMKKTSKVPGSGNPAKKMSKRVLFVEYGLL